MKFWTRWLWVREVRRHRRWLKRNKVLLTPHHSTRRNGAESVP